jgi:signal transduction histidine kinase
MNLLTMTQPLRDRRWFGFVFGLFAVLVSLAIRIALGDTALKFPFVIFIPPVVLTTFLGGVRPGIAAAVLAGVIANLTLIAPPGSIWPAWPDGWIAMGFYGLTISIDIALIQGMITAFQRAGAAEHDLRLLNEELECRVAERTSALQRQEAEREAAEAQVRQLQKMESVGQLTGGIAHDFNNMLAVVIGSLEMARRRIGDPAQLGVYIDRAEDGAKRAAQLTSRLLTFSRRQSLAPRILDANKLIAGMSDLLRRSLGETVEFETLLAAGLWPTFADFGQVENAILNLALNARDAMPTGGRLTIKTANHGLEAHARSHADMQPGQYVLISVTDTGTGMAPQVVERAFDPFFTTKEEGKGTGLGLSQVYGFAKQSGGHVAIYSQTSRGTTIRLYLPRHDDGERSLDSAPVAVSAASAVGNEIILVVEDKTEVRIMSADSLRELGYTVLQAEDANQALSVLAVQPKVDLLFTDVVMPGIDGRQLAVKAKDLRPGLKILYTTGFAPNAITQGGNFELPLAFLPKPYTISELSRKVREVLDG